MRLESISYTGVVSCARTSRMQDEPGGQRGPEGVLRDVRRDDGQVPV